MLHRAIKQGSVDLEFRQVRYYGESYKKVRISLGI